MGSGTDDWYAAHHCFAILGGERTHRETTVINPLRFLDGRTEHAVIPTPGGLPPHRRTPQ
jgi:hypothetical protein